MKVDDVEECGFHQLALNEWSANTHDGLVWKGEFAFGKGINFELPIELPQVIEIAFTKEGLTIRTLEGGQVIEFCFVECELVKKVGCWSGSSDDSCHSAKGCPAIEEMEDGLAIGHAILPVAITHGELVKVGEEG